MSQYNELWNIVQEKCGLSIIDSKGEEVADCYQLSELGQDFIKHIVISHNGFVLQRMEK